MQPYYDQDGITIYNGDCRDVLDGLPASSVDLVLADPPYSTGGAFRSDRSLSTKTKYVDSAVKNARPSFSGDNRDQRAFERWCEGWLAQSLSVTTEGGAAMVFIDWRNLPSMIDAIQMGGWVYRALIPWNKSDGVRPHRGWFRNQCEYIVGGTAGAMKEADDCICQAGFFYCPSAAVRADGKFHQTQKPLSLLQAIMKTNPGWETILDPFVGSGSTLLAARNMGRKAIGIEISEEFCETAVNRLAQKTLF